MCPHPGYDSKVKLLHKDLWTQEFKFDFWGRIYLRFTADEDLWCLLDIKSMRARKNLPVVNSWLELRQISYWKIEWEDSLTKTEKIVFSFDGGLMNA